MQFRGLLVVLLAGISLLLFSCKEQSSSDKQQSSSDKQQTPRYEIRMLNGAGYSRVYESDFIISCSGTAITFIEKSTDDSITIINADIVIRESKSK